MFRKTNKFIPLKFPHRAPKLEYLIAIGSGIFCAWYTWYPNFNQSVDNKTEINLDSSTE